MGFFDGVNWENLSVASIALIILGSIMISIIAMGKGMISAIKAVLSQWQDASMKTHSETLEVARSNQEIHKCLTAGFAELTAGIRDLVHHVEKTCENVDNCPRRCNETVRRLELVAEAVQDAASRKRQKNK